MRRGRREIIPAGGCRVRRACPLWGERRVPLTGTVHSWEGEMTVTGRGMTTSSVSTGDVRIPPYSDPGLGGGWLLFAGTILGLAGFMRIIDSIWAFSYHGSLPDNLQDGVLGSNLHNYAWLWLIVGVLLIVSSFMVLVQSQFARWFGMIASGIAALSAATWMPYYPIWGLVYIALALTVIYALSAHGAPVRD